jgi:hypothetical protein
MAHYFQVANCLCMYMIGVGRSGYYDCRDGFCGNDGEQGRLIMDVEIYKTTFRHDMGKAVR